MDLCFIKSGKYWCFPHDNGDGTFILSAANRNKDKLDPHESVLCNCDVKVYIPNDSFGLITTNPNNDYSGKVIDNYIIDKIILEKKLSRIILEIKII